MQDLVVKHLMGEHPPAIRLGTALTQTVDILLKYRMTGLPVIDTDMKVHGFISEQDCLRNLLVSSYHCEGQAVVDDVMNRDPFVVGPDYSVVDLAEQMLEQKPKVYPVVENERLVGLVTRSQVLAELRDSRLNCG